MLKTLLIKNYTIIKEVNISFNNGLQVITGETGAGKSILLGALELVLGSRADRNALFDQSQKCIVEAVFDDLSPQVKSALKKEDLDVYDEMVIRRELTPEGRSRAFINDSPVKLNTLKNISEQVVNIHKQHETLDILSPKFQMNLLDAYAGLLKTKSKYTDLYHRYAACKKELVNKKEEAANRQKEIDFLTFQIKEIEGINLNPESDDRIPDEIKRIENSEDIQQVLNQIYLAIDGQDENISNQLGDLIHQLQKYTTVDSNISDLANRLNSVFIELKDLGCVAEDMMTSFSNDGEQVAILQERSEQLNSLFFKHQVPNSQILFERFTEMQDNLDALQNQEQILADLEMEVATTRKEAMKVALELNKKRSKAIPSLIKKLESKLQDLALPNGKFDVQFTEEEELNSEGMNTVSFLFRANPGTPFAALKQAASGGELSRVALGLKSLIAGKLNLACMVFDEIDSGVSGETALRVGMILKELATEHQIIVITHSPQVAALGQQHYFVEKEVIKKQTHTKIRELSLEERSIKIAVMLSANPPTKGALKNAEELLSIT